MDWPFNYHSKGRPKVSFRLWSLTYLALILGFLNPFVGADSSPPVADVEDLFKDEGFLRMSRGGEAFGRRPPPPPLIHGPPHFTTQPPRAFPTASPKDRSINKPPGPPLPARNDGGGESKIPQKNKDNNNNNGGGSPGLPNRANSRDDSDGKQLSSSDPQQSPPSPKKEKGDSGGESDAHPLLGITPAAPGEAFDFNPILSNPAVTRILAGSSGRIPQWEPTLPDLHDLIPEVNYTADPSGPRGGGGGGGGGYSNPYNPPKPAIVVSPSSPPTGPGITPGSSSSNSNPLGGGLHNPKNPVFVPSPVSSKGSGTMYNMDQLTNNIAIPKHTLPNPSNLATSRSTVVSDEKGDSGSSHGGGGHHGNGHNNNNNNNNNGGGGGGGGSDDNPDSRYGPNSVGNNLDESRGENPYSYDEEDGNNNGGGGGGGGGGEDSAKTSFSSGSGPGGGEKRGWNEQTENRDENGPKYIVCDALCGAWKHQCKLMGILFSITSVLCLVLAFVVLYSLHFNLRDFVPFSVILLFLFTASTSRAFILLGGWFCSPDSRPSWLPMLSTLPSTFFAITFLIALHLARFPFPFIKSYNTIPSYVILIISLAAGLPPLFLSLGAYFHPTGDSSLSQVAWITAHLVLVIVSLVYLFKFKSFYLRLASERNSAQNGPNGNSNTCGPNGTSMGGSAGSVSNGTSNLSTLKKRGFVVKWGCLQARAMFGASLLALTLSTMIIVSVAMGRGECETSSTWAGWVLSLCARMLEFAIVILLLVVTIFSADVRVVSRLTRVPINKSNVGLINTDIYPTMVSSNTAVQRCIPMYSSNARADVMMLGPTESRSSLRGKTFGERALPGERLGEYRSSVGRGLPLRLGNGGGPGCPSHSMPGTPVDGFPQGLKLPEPAPASLLVTKVVFGTPAVSREVSHTHQHENPLLCTGGPGSKEETSNIYASLESVKIAPFVNAGSSTGSNHSGSDRVLLSAPRDYIYSISRDLTKTIDSIYDASRPRANNLAHTIETLCPPLAHTIDQIGSIPNLSGGGGGGGGRGGPHFNFHPHSLHHSNGGGSMGPGRTDLARTIDRIRYAAAAGGQPHPPPHPPGASSSSSNPGRNFVLQLGNNGGAPGSTAPHLPGMGNPPPYCSSESSHDVTPDSGIVSDIHSKAGRLDVPEVVYSRDYSRNSVEDVRRLPLLPLSKHHRPHGGMTPLYDRTPTSPTVPSLGSSPATTGHPGSSSSSSYLQNANNGQPNHSVVGRVEHLLNQTEHILSRTESLDSNSHSAGLQRLLSHKEQLEHVERLLAQAEYAIWLEKKTAQSVSSHLAGPDGTSYGFTNGNPPPLPLVPPGIPSSSSGSGGSGVQCKDPKMVVNNHENSNRNSVTNNASSNCNSKKLSKELEEESVV